MTNTLFTKPNDLAPVTKARSVDINNLSASVAAAFAKLPDELALKSGAVNFAADTGAVNAYAATLDPKVTAYADGLEVKLRITRANTGAATLNVNGLGAIAIKRVDGTPALAGDIPAGATLTLTYVASANAFYLPAVVVGTLNVAVAAAAQSVQDAAAQVQLAAGQAAAAATSAGQSQGYATNSSNSAQASATSAAASEASRIAADKRFLGNKAAAPTKDNQGANLEAGAAYYDTTLAKLQVWNGAAWTAGINTVAGVSSLNGNTGDLTLKTVNGLSLVGAGDIVPTAIQRFARVANTQLVAGDKSKWLQLSGTFTQTFDTPANLGQGWFIYVTNAGTGNIQIPLSDGLANWYMFPNETRLFVCDGNNIASMVITAYRFTSQVSGNFIKPPGYNYHRMRLVGAGAGGCGGGGGGASNTPASGAGGGGGGGAGGASGSTTDTIFADAVLPASVPFTIGAGGNGGAGAIGRPFGSNSTSAQSGNPGTAGNASTFGSSSNLYYMTAAGGVVNNGNQAYWGNDYSWGGTGGVAGTAPATVALATTWNGGVSFPTAATILGTVGATAAGLVGGNGGNGGVGASSSMTSAPVAAAIGGNGGAAAGSNGASPASSTYPGTGGNGGAGGGGGCTGAGGNGGNGAAGTAGALEMVGII